MPRKETYSGPISAQAQQNLVSEGIENFELPKSVVMKIAKSSIPDNVKLQKETVLSLVKGSTVFINFLAATAHDVAQSKQHKSISASDVLKALETIEFGDMVNTLQAELQIYRELSKNDKSKKGTTSNGASTSPKKGPGGSTSASAPPVPKGKGKEKPSTGGNPLPMPFTSAPLEPPPAMAMPMAMHPRVAELSGAGAGVPTPMNVDDENTSVSTMGPMEDDHDEMDDREAVGAEHFAEDEVIVSEEEQIDQDDEEEDEEEEDVELEDKVALEEEELRRDGLGVEQRTMMDDEE